jgi:hypothetical protein
MNTEAFLLSAHIIETPSQEGVSLLHYFGWRKMKKLAIILGIAVLTMGLCAYPSASAGTTIDQLTPDSYSVSSEFMSFLYQGSTALSIRTYEVSGTSDAIFEEITIQNFSPIEEPYVDPVSSKVIANGQFATAKMHSNPGAILDFETKVQNIANFRISQNIGAINLGSSLYLGNSEMRAEIILKGEGNISSFPNNEYSFLMDANSSLIFRNNFVDLQPIGDSIAQGAIAGELFVSKDQHSVVDDLVDYLPISMNTEHSGGNELKVKVDGDFDEGKVLIFDISKDVLELTSEEMTIKLDDNVLESAPSQEVLGGSSGEPIYTMVENEDYFQIYLFAPSLSTHTVTFGAITPYTPALTEIAAGLGIAVLVTIVSAIFMFRRKKDY